MYLDCACIKTVIKKMSDMGNISFYCSLSKSTFLRQMLSESFFNVVDDAILSLQIKGNVGMA